MYCVNILHYIRLIGGKMSNQLYKKNIKVIAILFVILLLVPIVPAMIPQVKNVDRLKSLWGGGGVTVHLKEMYGSPEDPEFCPLPNVTVKVWLGFTEFAQNKFRFIRRCINGFSFLPDKITSFIVNITIKDIRLTDEFGNIYTYMQGICVLWMFQISKNGYFCFRFSDSLIRVDSVAPRKYTLHPFVFASLQISNMKSGPVTLFLIGVLVNFEAHTYDVLSGIVRSALLT